MESHDLRTYARRKKPREIRMSRGMWVQNATTNDGLSGVFQTIRMKKYPQKREYQWVGMAELPRAKGTQQFRPSAT